MGIISTILSVIGIDNGVVDEQEIMMADPPNAEIIINDNTSHQVDDNETA